MESFAHPWENISILVQTDLQAFCLDSWAVVESWTSSVHLGISGFFLGMITENFGTRIVKCLKMGSKSTMFTKSRFCGSSHIVLLHTLYHLQFTFTAVNHVAVILRGTALGWRCIWLHCEDAILYIRLVKLDENVQRHYMQKISKDGKKRIEKGEKDVQSKIPWYLYWLISTSWIGTTADLQVAASTRNRKIEAGKSFPAKLALRHPSPSCAKLNSHDFFDWYFDSYCKPWLNINARKCQNAAARDFSSEDIGYQTCTKHPIAMREANAADALSHAVTVSNGM